MGNKWILKASPTQVGDRRGPVAKQPAPQGANSFAGLFPHRPPTAPALALLLLVSLLASACGAAPMPPTQTPGVSQTPRVLTVTPAIAPTTAAIASLPSDPLERHQTFSNGLTVDEYALTGAPTLDPLNFTTRHSTRAAIESRHFKDGGAVPSYNSGFDGQGPYLAVEWRGQTLTAHEIYTNETAGIITVLLADQLLYTLPIGQGGPLNALQQLLTVGDHWYLEADYATYGHDPLTSLGTVTTTGQIVEDGVLLNASPGTEQLFGLQLLRGQPFYFSQQAGRIDAVYNGQTLLLGYDSVSHYGCCSYAELNPQPRANMVSFLAQKGDVWFFVQIGDY